MNQLKILRYIMIRKETEKESKEASKQEKQLLCNRWKNNKMDWLCLNIHLSEAITDYKSLLVLFGFENKSDAETSRGKCETTT